LLLPSFAFAAKTLTYIDFLHQLTDLDRLTHPQDGITAGQFSSWDRNDVNAWGANGDAGQYLRVEPGGEAVMMDIDGPGCIYRTWSANPKGRIRIYLDGATTPTFDWDFNALFLGDQPPIPRPIIWKRGGPDSSSDCYLPLPFAKHIKITADRAWGQYYHFNYLLFPKDWTIPSFRLPLTSEENVALREVADAWGTPGRDPKPRFPNTKTDTRAFTIKPGQTVVLADLAGPAEIRGLRATVKCSQRYFWRKLLLRGVWDGSTWPQVLAPLGPFFGFDWYTAEYGSLITGCQKGQCYFYYPMPFRRSGRLELTSHLSLPAEVTFEVKWAPRPNLSADALYFFARWRHEPRSQTFDYPFLETAGRGHFVGVALAVDHPSPGWWGEGDEKVWVDGDQFPKWIGTGSEDYFGDAWGIRYLPEPSFGCSYDQGPRTCPYRWHFMDHIPFTDKFRMTLENYPPYDKEYATVAFWYQAEIVPPLKRLVDAKYIGAAQPGQKPSEQKWRPDRFHNLTADDLLTYGLGVADTLEAEDLLAGKAVIIDDAARPYEFNMERAVDLGDAQPGQALAEFTLAAPEASVYFVEMLTAPEAGVADLALEIDGQKLSVEGRPAKNVLNLTGLYLTKGDHTAKVVALTAGHAIFDALKYRPAPSDPGVVEAESLTVLRTTGGADMPKPSPPWQGVSAGRVLEFHATAQDQGMVLGLSGDPSAAFILGVRPMNGPAAGIMQAFIAGKPIGPAFDLYAPEKRPGRVVPLGAIPPGPDEVEVRVVGKNPASSGYHIGLDYIRFEPKILGPGTVEGVWAEVLRTEGCGYQIQVLGPQWIGNHHLWLAPCWKGGFVDLGLHLPKEGDYDIVTRLTTSWDYAIVQPSLDDKPLGAPIDTFTKTVLQTQLLTLGRAHLTAGLHVLRFQAVDKNADSQGYLAGIDYVSVKLAQ
jgi:hypothetical protein